MYGVAVMVETSHECGGVGPLSAVQGGTGVLASEACAHKLEETLLTFDKVCGGWRVTGARVHLLMAVGG